MGEDTNPGQHAALPVPRARWRRLVQSPLPEGILFIVVAAGLLVLIAAAGAGPLLGVDAGIVHAITSAAMGFVLLALVLLRLAVPGPFVPVLRGGLPFLVLSVVLFAAGWLVIGPPYLFLRPAPLIEQVGSGLFIGGVVSFLIFWIVWSRWATGVRRQGNDWAPPPSVAHPRLALAASLPLLALLVGFAAWFAAEAPALFPAYTLSGLEGVDALAWSPDGRSLAMEGTAGPSGVIGVWDVASRRPLWQSPCENLLGSVAWSADGAYVAAGCGYELADGTGAYNVDVWNGLTGVRVATYGPTSPTDAPSPSGFAWAPSGEALAILETTPSGSTPMVEFYDAPGGLISRILPLPFSPQSFAWSPDGRYLALGSGNIEVVSAASGHVVATFQGADLAVLGLLWSPDGASLAAVGSIPGQSWETGGYVSVWRVSSGARVFAVATGNFNPPVAWSPDSRLLAVGVGGHVNGSGVAGDSGVARVFDVGTGHAVYTWRGQSSSGGIRALVWSPDGRSIASGDFDPSVAVWRLPSTAN